MKKLVLFVVAGVIALGSISAWAGGACCAKKKNSASSCVDGMASLNLSDEQKAKIADIEAACKAAGSDKAACAKAKEEIGSLLTAEQRTEWDAACASKKTDS